MTLEPDYIHDSDKGEYLTQLYDALEELVSALTGGKGNSTALPNAKAALVRVKAAEIAGRERALDDALLFCDTREECRQAHERLGFDYSPDHPAYSLSRGLS